MIGKIRNLSANVRRAMARPMYGFIPGHGYLTPARLREIGSLLHTRDDAPVRAFEAAFAARFADAQAIAFAAARMGFHAVLRARSIGAGDEVVLLGSTCAVMANAVLRIGAKPVYADIDPATFGSCAAAIAQKLSARTRMIVAQHSFGIPCDIAPIVALARSRSIWLVEDAAIALGSSRDGVAVGNFADTVLISTDHTKPINTLIGGLVLTRDPALARALRDIEVKADSLPEPKQKALWQRLLFERSNAAPRRYASMPLREQFARYSRPAIVPPFLTDDSGPEAGTGYPYPAKMPAALAAIGLEELQRWDAVAAERKALLRRLLQCVRGTWVESHLPAAYRDARLDIVPLRFVWSEPQGRRVRTRLSHFVDVGWTWFMQPLIATAEPLARLGYASGSCPLAERLGPGMVNLPCHDLGAEADTLVRLFAAALRGRDAADNATTEPAHVVRGAPT